MDRRNFLRTVAGAVAAAAIPLPVVAAAKPRAVAFAMMGDKAYLLTHIRSHIEINAQRTDVRRSVLVTFLAKESDCRGPQSALLRSISVFERGFCVFYGDGPKDGGLYNITNPPGVLTDKHLSFTPIGNGMVRVEYGACSTMAVTPPTPSETAPFRACGS